MNSLFLLTILLLFSVASSVAVIADDDTSGHKPRAAELREKLSPLEYAVTQEESTEPPFHNRYWDNHEPGIYVDIVSGEPLFSSRDKFDSGTGWPSFTRPLEPGNVQTRSDYSLLVPRTEVRSTRGDSHLGHLFNDGPAPTGKRFCINSASLRFVPAGRLREEGYEKYAAAFESGANEAQSDEPGAHADKER